MTGSLVAVGQCIQEKSGFPSIILWYARRVYLIAARWYSSWRTCDYIVVLVKLPAVSGPMPLEPYGHWVVVCLIGLD